MNRLKMAFIRAGRWIKRCARPLEVARWEYLFEGGSRERVLEILGAYQNEDGGFGHGLKPDFWLPSSSPMATWAAVRILSEVDVEPRESNGAIPSRIPLPLTGWKWYVASCTAGK